MSEARRSGDPLLRGLYAAGQAARVGLYWGQYLLSARMTTPVKSKRPIEGPFPGREAVMADLRALLEEDWRNVAEGRYRVPHDLLTSPVEALAKARRYFRELRAVEERRHAHGHGEMREELPEDPGAYPRYYLQNFHYQSGGWLSEDSARIYDHQVEVLFAGGADAMRRQALVPLAEFMAGRKVRETRFLDVACGTGRFLTFVKDNYPRMAVTALDLSPQYLEEARRLLKPWRGVSFHQAAAEDTGLESASFDAASCIFLFHELPPKVRPLVARELARIVKPGGLLLFVDSLQLGDHPPYDPLLRYFPVAFHEPYYGSYVACDLEGLFAEAGFTLQETRRAFLSRVMTFRRDEGASAAP